METVDRRGTRVDYTHPRGHDLIDTLELRDANGPLDMSLYTVRFRVWAIGVPSYSQPGTITEGSGSATLRLTPADIAALPGKVTYDLALVDAGGIVTPGTWGEITFTGVDL